MIDIVLLLTYTPVMNPLLTAWAWLITMYLLPYPETFIWLLGVTFVMGLFVQKPDHATKEDHPHPYPSNRMEKN